ncbi:MAG: NAD(P)H-dependent oxidoreductase [Flavobacteriales bacterium]|nr:NAD(P)H-dependent oxidoreductase [Flavobacteriales bacterium]
MILETQYADVDIAEVHRIKSELNWRMATKKFNPSAKVDQRAMEAILASIQLAPTSYGLQPFTVLQIEDRKLRDELRPKSWGQTQITDADKLLVFCNHKKVGPEAVSAHLDRRADALGVPRENMNNAEVFMNAKIQEKDTVETPHWTAKQAYIALGFAMSACARLEIDCCPIEGFEPSEYDRILGLKEKGLEAAVVLAIGYRSKNHPEMPKFRKDREELFKTI